MSKTILGSILAAAVGFSIFWFNPLGIGDKVLFMLDPAFARPERITISRFYVHSASTRDMPRSCLAADCTVSPGGMCELSSGDHLSQKGEYGTQVVALIDSHLSDYETSPFYGDCTVGTAIYMSRLEWFSLSIEQRWFERQKAKEQDDLRHMQEIAVQGSAN